MKFLNLILVLFVPCVSCSQLKNVTREVFGSDLDVLPLAFGDFNSDKLTDIVVLNDKDRSRFSVLLAKPQTFSIAIENYFNNVPDDVLHAGLSCAINNFDVLAAAPADFDGDGGMDVLVVAKKYELEEGIGNKVVTLLFWGEHDAANDTHTLECNGPYLTLEMNAQPLVLDANGDNIADLFTTVDNKRGIFYFSNQRNVTPEFVPFNSSRDIPFRFPHSNGFVDMSGDGNADIFVTAGENIELWENTGNPEEHFKYHADVSYPDSCDNTSRCIGQSAFADFDLDGKLDVLIPACMDEACSEGRIYYSSLHGMWKSEAKSPFTEAIVDLGGNWKFDPTDMKEKRNIYRSLTPRVGDINLDGYPDIIMRLRHLQDTSRVQMHVLLNVKGEEGKRKFLLQQEIMEGMNDTILATFYDLYENGLEDMIIVRKKEADKYEIAAYANLTQNSDANFVKIIVLSGICYKNCYAKHIDVPYGTNIPGQTVCYRTQRPGTDTFAIEIQSCAAQLAQTAHHALQLPYTIFGLGLAPNFLDFMFVNVTNSSSISSSKAWPQIIPNSQLYVIPHPPNEPIHWQVKLFITPSRGITLTGLALVGTCFICMVIIIFFHWRERIQDRREKLQQPNQFHFDAM